MEPSLRPARLDDAPMAAELLRLSMDEYGYSLFEFGGHPGNRTLTGLFQRGGHRFSFEETTVAEMDGKAAGFMISYAGARLSSLDLGVGRQWFSLYGLRGFFRLAFRAIPMMGVHEAERDEYYVSNLAVLPRFQGQGIGTRLLAFADEQARRAGLMKCSLNVESANHGAFHLYERMGYRRVLDGSDASSEVKYYRMVKQIATEH